MGTCGGPSHLSGESLDAVHPSELRCQSQEDIIKEEEAARIMPRPTEEPNKVKCPANCVCEVSVTTFLYIYISFNAYHIFQADFNLFTCICQ